jgi:hypothetical protein
MYGIYVEKPTTVKSDSGMRDEPRSVLVDARPNRAALRNGYRYLRAALSGNESVSGWVWAGECVIGGSFNILTPPGTVKSTMHNSVRGAVIAVGFSFGSFKWNKCA